MRQQLSQFFIFFYTKQRISENSVQYQCLFYNLYLIKAQYLMIEEKKNYYYAIRF